VASSGAARGTTRHLFTTAVRYKGNAHFLVHRFLTSSFSPRTPFRHFSPVRYPVRCSARLSSRSVSNATDLPTITSALTAQSLQSWASLLHAELLSTGLSEVIHGTRVEIRMASHATSCIATRSHWSHQIRASRPTTTACTSQITAAMVSLSTTRVETRTLSRPSATATTSSSTTRQSRTLSASNNSGPGSWQVSVC